METSLSIALPFIVSLVSVLGPIYTPSGRMYNSAMQLLSMAIIMTWIPTILAPLSLMFKFIMKFVDISAEDYSIEVETRIEELKTAISNMNETQDELMVHSDSMQARMGIHESEGQSEYFRNSHRRGQWVAKENVL